MKYLSKENINNNKVLLRCDFNVPVDSGIITDNSKIIKSLDTINYLLENNNKVIILSHFGRVNREEYKYKNSLKIVYEELKKYIDLDFIPNPENIEVILNKSNKNCFLVENTRYTDVPEKRESINDLELAHYWSTFADIFVIDAFASLHRVHSSTAGVSKYLPTYLGFLVEKELDGLNELIEINKRPFTVIMGGAKVDDKIKIIEGMLSKCDNLILTGGILNTFYKVMGKNIGNSLVSNDEDVLNSVKNILGNYQDKIFCSDNFIVDRNGYVIEVTQSEIKDEDIIYDNIINIDAFTNSKLIFVNGTCGKYEDDNYKRGTVKLLNDLDKCDADVYIGGGDTVSSVNKFKMNEKFKYLSSGGGATLEYVAYGKLMVLITKMLSTFFKIHKFYYIIRQMFT